MSHKHPLTTLNSVHFQFFQTQRDPINLMNGHDNKKPPLNVVNVIIFIGLPVAALALVPLWGIYDG